MVSALCHRTNKTYNELELNILRGGRAAVPVSVLRRIWIPATPPSLLLRYITTASQAKRRREGQEPAGRGGSGVR